MPGKGNDVTKNMSDDRATELAHAIHAHDDAESGTIPVGAHQATGARVLVIDDETEIGRVIRRALVAGGYAVEWASTAAQGTDRVAQWHPDVVILDLSLPDADGIEVA